MKKIYLYTRFERFWHWAQALLICGLLWTGFAVHGDLPWPDFYNAVIWHNRLGIAWLILFAFIIFWEATTGEWRHYVPTTRKLFAVARYYLLGIFKGESHPVAKTPEAKHNPLQRLTYLGVALVIVPVQVVTGLLYWTYSDWHIVGFSMDLGLLAFVHVAGAFLFLIFLVIHVYMITTGHTPFAHLKAMITGWEEVGHGEKGSNQKK
ncbi:thiosulfate reductase cytochrome b subunit [Desulfobotulus alkaliphilus]|uniref:Thiosulfate reductase cytochrome b subunit n=1 Tax=Desulfobotulus alkaliphilus TaxID=622671 RepID=A0A562S2I7_9BACT|nr:cytochrome b/b6 domain-containing protein [Desulfobotulus alkaliphilus]TWI75579.1 thiosulfate reductase cytochrome b subunit [Desulfobotulus alkaliphilus]